VRRVRTGSIPFIVIRLTVKESGWVTGIAIRRGGIPFRIVRSIANQGISPDVICRLMFHKRLQISLILSPETVFSLLNHKRYL
jgi:hypothetical protein